MQVIVERQQGTRQIDKSRKAWVPPSLVALMAPTSLPQDKGVLKGKHGRKEQVRVTVESSLNWEALGLDALEA